MARRFRTISIRNELFLGVCLDRRESRRGCSERLREPVVGRAFFSLRLQDDRMIKTILLRSDLEFQLGDVARYASSFIKGESLGNSGSRLSA